MFDVTLQDNLELFSSVQNNDIKMLIVPLCLQSFSLIFSCEISFPIMIEITANLKDSTVSNIHYHILPYHIASMLT